MKKGKLKSMTITEASDSFDVHDMFECDDVKEMTDIKFNLSKKKHLPVQEISLAEQEPK